MSLRIILSIREYGIGESRDTYDREEKCLQGLGGETHTRFWWRNAYKVLVEKCIQGCGGEMYTKFSWRNAYKV